MRLFSAPHPQLSVITPLEFLRATGRRVPGETRIGVNMRYASALFDRVDIRDNYKVAYAERWATVTPIVEIPEGTNVW